MNPAQFDNLPSSIPEPGEIIDSKYRVERLLGAGGMGVVVAASHLGLGQPVAIKLMLPDLATSAEFSARFLREARAAAAIRGDHAVRIFDVASAEDGRLYMVMELLEGEDLGQIIKKRGALPIAEAVDYLLQACDALGDAHAQGIVHRDLKPGNLFLAGRSKGSPVIKVLDFGISKSSTPGDAPNGPTLTVPDTMLGTPYYMSPEQFRSAKTVDARTDIWSLGLILHKLITGFSAFESDSVREHISMIAADPPAPLRLRRPDAPEGLEAIVLCCLEKDANLRFQNIGDLVAALVPFAPTRPGREFLVAPPDPAAIATPALTSPRSGEFATPTGTRVVGTPEIQTATTVTSSIARASALPRSTGRLFLTGVLVSAALLTGGLMAIRAGRETVVPTVGGPVISALAAPSDSQLPAAPPDLAAVVPLQSTSADAPTASNQPSPSAPSASARALKAGTPAAPRHPPSSRTAPEVKSTPRPSLTTFQPSGL